MTVPLPAWVRPADRALALAMCEIQLIRAVTPTNVEDETAALERAFARGAGRDARFCCAPRPVGLELRRALDEIAGFVDKEGPIGCVYAARARELALEAEMVDAVGTPRLTALARERFAPAGPDARADALARSWLDQRGTPVRDETAIVTSDPNDPRSLLVRMRAEVGRRKIPVRVVVEPGLASLAATGQGAVFVAQGRTASPAEVERTVVHEIEGHVLPRLRAASSPLGILAIGTARGLDDQEGRALLLERAMGLFCPARRRELGLRHLAARATLEGASFVSVARLLLGYGARTSDAVRIAARVQRGGPARGGGIAREILYLPALLRVRRAMARHGAGLERVMRMGRVAADAFEVVDRLVLGGDLHDPAAP